MAERSIAIGAFCGSGKDGSMIRGESAEHRGDDLVVGAFPVVA